MDPREQFVTGGGRGQVFRHGGRWHDFGQNMDFPAAAKLNFSGGGIPLSRAGKLASLMKII
jgi:hypothetical protein